MKKFLNRRTADKIEKAVKNAVGTTVKMAREAVDKMAEITKDTSMLERLESAIMETLMTDSRLQFILSSIEQKYEVPSEMLVGAMMNDKAYTVKEYILTVNGNVVVFAEDYTKLVNKLTALVLTEDETEMKEFVGLIEKALKS